MADNAMSFKAGGAPVDTGAAPGAGGAENGGSSPTRAASVLDLMQLMSTPTKLSKEGEAYMATIIEELTKTGREPKVTSITGPNYEARVLEHNGYITAFVFAETYQPGVPAYPAASVVNDLRGRFVAHGINGASAIFKVVTKEDYEKVDIMASLVVNSYKCHDTPAFRNFTAAGLSQGNFGLTDDMSIIKPFVERHCPDATLPRMDVGVMLYINQPVTNEFNTGNNGRPEFTRTPVVAVTGYTDFVYAEDQSLNGITGSQVKYVPIFVITGIFSTIVDVSMAAIGISLTSYLMIGKSFWAKQFAVFKKDAPNIGNLLKNNETGAPMEVTTIEERNSVITNFLTTPYPYLAIDLQLGGFVIPGLGKLIDGGQEFNQLIDNFTGGEGATRAGKATQLTTHHFDGRVRKSKTGEFVDTRCIDYLSLIKAGYPQNEVSSFLRAMQVPEFKSKEIARVDPDAEFYYVTYRAFLNPQFVVAVAEDLGRSLKVRIDAAMDIGTYNIGALSGWQQTGIGQMPGFAVTSTVGGFNGSWCWN